jgi:glycosyltransferase involved in cell wall biosynthesis
MLGKKMPQRGKQNLKKKRILFISNSSKMGGGTNSFLISLLEYIHDDYECAVVSDRHSSQLKEALQKYSVPYFALRDRVVLFFPALLAMILLGKFDLIYGNGANGRSQWALWAAKLTGKPFIWHIHESVNRTSYGHGLESADALIANSHDTADCIRMLAPCANPIEIPCGIDPQLFELDKGFSREELGYTLGLNPDWFRIINVGRFCHDKNQMDLVHVAQQVIEKFPKTYFILMGVVVEPEYLDELKNEVKLLGLSRNVIFHDYVTNVSSYLCGSDLMVHTAKKEPQGLVILEAMAARLPVVAYEVGGVGESVIQGETGILRPFGDIDGLTQAICSLVENKDKRKQMGEEGCKRVKEYYSAEQTASRIQSITDNVLCNHYYRFREKF